MLSSLRGRLMAAFLIIGIAAVGAVGYIAIAHSQRSLVEIAQREGEALVVGLSGEIDQYIKSRLAFLELQTEIDDIKSMDWARQQPLLARALKRFGGFEQLVVADVAGNTISTQGFRSSIANRDYFREMLSEPRTLVSEPVVSKETGNVVVVMACPIFRDGALVGVLVGPLDLKELSNIILSTKWGKSGYAYAVDKNGVVLIHPDQSLVGNLNVSIKGEEVSEELAAGTRQALGGKRGVMRYTFKGVDKFTAYAPIQSVGWAVSITSPAVEFLAPISALRKNLFITIAVVAVAIVAVALWIASGISRPVAVIADKMQQLASGDLSSKLEVKSSLAEIKVLSRAVNDMIHGVSGLIASVSEEAKSVTTDAEDVSASAQENTASVEEISASMSKINERVQEVAGAVEETTASIQEIASSAQNGAQAAAEAGEQAEEISRLAENGSEAVSEIARRAELVDRARRMSDDAMRNLVASVENILKFVSLISGIADQTNLLALNAAIEAARAGEHGRGFAVVAEEVRKLAEETSKAAKEVSQVVAQVKQRTDEALNDQAEAAKNIEEMAKQTKGAQRAIVEVVGKIKAVADKVQSLAAIMEEQSASSQEMASAVEHISKTIQEIAGDVDSVTKSINEQSKAIESLAKISEDLLKSGENMRKSVQHFKLAQEGGGNLALATI